MAFITHLPFIHTSGSKAASSWPQFCKPSIARYAGLKDDRASQVKETEATPDVRAGRAQAALVGSRHWGNCLEAG